MSNGSLTGGGGMSSESMSRGGGVTEEARSNWPLFEVFLRSKRGLNHVHVRSRA
jgi:hypothetical protein